MFYGDAVVIDGGELSLSNTIEDGVQQFMPILPDGYSGQTVITPTQNEQVLATAGLVVAENIIINPIPSNYGLITWDGSTLTVS